MREFEIERQFDIKIESLKPNKGVYILKTDKGMRCLKKIDYGVQKLLFVQGAKEHLINQGYNRIDKYCLNIEGNPYALVNEDIYTLSYYIEGRECDFHNISEINNASKNLAELYLASRGYEPPENSKLKTDLERWPHLMDKRIKSLDKMKDMARKKRDKTAFDLNYIKSLDFYKDMGRKAMKVLLESRYNEICVRTEEEKSFCHHDYTYHNIIIDNNEEYNVIDFDYCKREIRTYDLSAFMIKVLKRQDFNIDVAVSIIDQYNTISPLLEEEYKVLYAFLLFPQRFWRLTNRYYYNEVNWSQTTFENKLSELINEREKYLNFIECFKEKYNLKE